MKVDRATQKDVPDLKRLWQLVFGDDERFLDSFFRHIFSPGDCLVQKEHSRIVSMLFMIPAVWSASEEISVRYIYGCATHPDYRRMGLMGNLLNEAVNCCDRAGVPLALVPESGDLARYYGQFGFDRPTTLRRMEYQPINSSGNYSGWQTVPWSAQQSRTLAEFRDSLWKGRNAILWSIDYLTVVLGEILYQGGEMVTLNTVDRPVHGYALAVPCADTVHILECASIYGPEETVESLRNHYNGKKRFSLWRPRPTENPHRLLSVFYMAQPTLFRHISIWRWIFEAGSRPEGGLHGCVRASASAATAFL